MNPYISDINSNIIKRKYVNNKTHIVLKDDILLDYEKYNIEPETIFINNEIPEEIYNSSLGKAYVINKKPQTDLVSLYIKFDIRLSILKSITSRLLIKSVLNKYFVLEPLNFKTNKDQSSFEINAIYFENEVKEIVKYLEDNINTYIKYGLDIYSNKENNKTWIDGLYETEYIPYTVGNLSELKKFTILDYSFNNQGVKFTYSII